MARPTSPTVTKCSTVTSPVASSTATATPTAPISQNGGSSAVSPWPRTTPIPTASPASAPNHSRITAAGSRSAPAAWINPPRLVASSGPIPADSAAMTRSRRHRSSQAAFTAKPTTVVVRLAPVVHSKGVQRVSLWPTATAEAGTPSSRAAISARAVRLPCPISVLPVSRVTDPSACILTWAVEMGEAPASLAVTATARPRRTPNSSGRACRSSSAATASRSAARSASRPRLPEMIVPPGCNRLRRRSSVGSIPSRSAAMSMFSSPARAP